MANIITKTISKLFGSKSDRDIKALWPRVEQVNYFYRNLQGLTHDELRNKTTEFKNRISEYLSEVDQEMQQYYDQMRDDPDMHPEEKEKLYEELDRLEKERDKQLEEVLDDLLPEVFAVMKETARRFKDYEVIEASATELDRELATTEEYLDIKGEEAYFQTKWDAAGIPIDWDMVHFDVQLIGGMVLHQGKISEMATGEGKTLVSTLPAYLNALSGHSVHIVTVNDFLAKRDSKWNGPLYNFLGMTVDCIEYYQAHSQGRKKAYQADIVYGTNNEFGFDYLRDNMARSTEEIVQRKHHFAMVDEIDSVLIDDARTPLVISGPTETSDKEQEKFYELKPRVEELIKAQKEYVNNALATAKKAVHETGIDKMKPTDEAAMELLRAYRGLPKNNALIKFQSEPGVKAFLQETENHFLQDQAKEMHKVDDELFFTVDEKNNNVELTDKGIELISRKTEDQDFFIMPNVGEQMAEIEREDIPDEEKTRKKDTLMRDFAIKSERIHTINQLLKAYTHFEVDVDYIISEGKIKIVDEQTGRVLDGRRYSDGLHQAIEAKENVQVESATQTYASVTLQNYFRMYHKLAGMTGTAETEAGEFMEIYGLDVVVVPTHMPVVREDKDDMVFKTKREKYNAVIDEVERLVNQGRPVLVGTTSVDVSELLSRMLKRKGLKHNVLNAKYHQKEAEIISEAGESGAITIATNMAGRGTDIKLGEGVVEAGGLAIVGTERHEARRVDRQLRGRAGRQGDPGSSQFFVSLEDNLMRLFGSEKIAKYMDRLGIEEGEVIQHSWVSNSIEKAQKKVEQNNFGIRKRLLEYDDVTNNQREVIYKKRRNALYGSRLAVDLNHMTEDLCEEIVEQYQPFSDYEGLKIEVMRVFTADLPFSEEEMLTTKQEELAQQLFHHISEQYRSKTERIRQKAYPVIKDVYEQRGQQIENIVVPFSDGEKQLQVSTNLKEAYETEGRQIILDFEKMTTLSTIDDAWKEHLREIDELKQSVQNAVYEQKDPLLVYKFESFKLFQQMLAKVNRDVLSLLSKADIVTDDADDVEEAQQPAQSANRQDQLQTSRTSDMPDSSGGSQDNGASTNTPEAPKQEPVKVGEKVGRNEQCPCGSGKKYKNCHGKS